MALWEPVSMRVVTCWLFRDDAGLMGPRVSLDMVCPSGMWEWEVLLMGCCDCLPSAHAEHVNGRACLSPAVVNFGKQLHSGYCF